jgi:hypothetical protein
MLLLHMEAEEWDMPDAAVMAARSMHAARARSISSGDGSKSANAAAADAAADAFTIEPTDEGAVQKAVEKADATIDELRCFVDMCTLLETPIVKYAAVLYPEDAAHGDAARGASGTLASLFDIELASAPVHRVRLCVEVEGVAVDISQQTSDGDLAGSHVNQPRLLANAAHDTHATAADLPDFSLLVSQISLNVSLMRLPCGKEPPLPNVPLRVEVGVGGIALVDNRVGKTGGGAANTAAGTGADADATERMAAAAAAFGAAVGSAPAPAGTSSGDITPPSIDANVFPVLLGWLDAKDGDGGDSDDEKGEDEERVMVHAQICNFEPPQAGLSMGAGPFIHSSSSPPGQTDQLGTSDVDGQHTLSLFVVDTSHPFTHASTVLAVDYYAAGTGVIKFMVLRPKPPPQGQGMEVDAASGDSCWTVVQSLAPVDIRSIGRNSIQLTDTTKRYKAPPGTDGGDDTAKSKGKSKKAGSKGGADEGDIEMTTQGAADEDCAFRVLPGDCVGWVSVGDGVIGYTDFFTESTNGGSGIGVPGSSCCYEEQSPAAISPMHLLQDLPSASVGSSLTMHRRATRSGPALGTPPSAGAYAKQTSFVEEADDSNEGPSPTAPGREYAYSVSYRTELVTYLRRDEPLRAHVEVNDLVFLALPEPLFAMLDCLLQCVDKGAVEMSEDEIRQKMNMEGMTAKGKKAIVKGAVSLQQAAKPLTAAALKGKPVELSVVINKASVCLLADQNDETSKAFALSAGVVIDVRSSPDLLEGESISVSVTEVVMKRAQLYHVQSAWRDSMRNAGPTSGAAERVMPVQLNYTNTVYALLELEGELKNCDVEDCDIQLKYKYCQREPAASAGAMTSYDPAAAAAAPGKSARALQGHRTVVLNTSDFAFNLSRQELLILLEILDGVTKAADNFKLKKTQRDGEKKAAAAKEQLVRERLMKDKSKEMLLEEFRKADDDGSGELETDEVQDLLTGILIKTGLTLDEIEDEVAEFILKVDSNGDGNVSTAEFVAPLNNAAHDDGGSGQLGNGRVRGVQNLICDEYKNPALKSTGKDGQTLWDKRKNDVDAAKAGEAARRATLDQPELESPRKLTLKDVAQAATPDSVKGVASKAMRASQEGKAAVAGAGKKAVHHVSAGAAMVKGGANDMAQSGKDAAKRASAAVVGKAKAGIKKAGGVRFASDTSDSKERAYESKETASSWQGAEMEGAVWKRGNHYPHKWRYWHFMIRNTKDSAGVHHVLHYMKIKDAPSVPGSSIPHEAVRDTINLDRLCRVCFHELDEETINHRADAQDYNVASEREVELIGKGVIVAARHQLTGTQNPAVLMLELDGKESINRKHTLTTAEVQERKNSLQDGDHAAENGDGDHPTDESKTLVFLAGGLDEVREWAAVLQRVIDGAPAESSDAAPTNAANRWQSAAANAKAVNTFEAQAGTVYGVWRMVVCVCYANSHKYEPNIQPKTHKHENNNMPAPDFA